MLWAAVQDTTLYIALYGQYDPPLVEWQREEMNRVPTWTIKRRNRNLAPQVKCVRSKGPPPALPCEPGWKWNIPAALRPNASLGVDYYRPPLPNYIEYGPP